jgi:hypothetical protein
VKPETRVQKDIEGAAETLGFDVYSFDQGYRPGECPECGNNLGRGAGGTRQTPGVSDLHLVHQAKELRVWVEVKAGRNRPTDAQSEFLVTVRSAGGHAFPAWSTADLLWGLWAAEMDIAQLPPWQETSKRVRDWLPALYRHVDFPWKTPDKEDVRA